MRAIENWRLVLANFSMKVVRHELNLSTFFDWTDNRFTPMDRRADETAEMFDVIEKAAG